MERRQSAIRKLDLGALVQKAGLDDRLDQDRAAILGALLDLVEGLKGPDDAVRVERWRLRGRGILQSVAHQARDPW